MDYKLYWTEEALENLKDILYYLSSVLTEREVKNFKKKLFDQLEIILRFPLIFPPSDAQPRLKKAVLSKQTILIYEIKDNEIFLVLLFDSRQNSHKIQ